MRAIMLGYGKWMVFGISALEFLIAVGLLSKVERKRGIFFFMSLIAFALFADTAVQAVGSFLKEGDLLAKVSHIRFIARTSMLAMIVPVSIQAMKPKKLITALGWLAGLALMAGGAFAALKVNLEPVSIIGVLRYMPSEYSLSWTNLVIQFIPVAAVIALLVCGFFIIKDRRNFALALSGLSVVFCAVFPLVTKNKDISFLFALFGELFMLFFLLFFTVDEDLPLPQQTE